MAGKSFFQAVQQLLTEVCNAISQQKGYTYIWAFGELGKAFDRLDRRKLMQKLASALRKQNPTLSLGISSDIFY
jgi:hypothetical protein